MKTKALPERQLEVMQALWGSSKAMTAMEIVGASGLAINTVQASLRSLVAKGYVQQGEVVYSGTVLARSYVPAVSQEEYKATLEELEKMIEQRRKELEGTRKET